MLLPKFSMMKLLLFGTIISMMVCLVFHLNSGKKSLVFNSELDIGTVSDGEQYDVSFVFRNCRPETVAIWLHETRTSDIKYMGHLGNDFPLLIPQNEERKLRFRIRARRWIPLRERQFQRVRVKTSDPNNPMADLTVHMNFKLP
jgi:hypothetical protein